MFERTRNIGNQLDAYIVVPLSVLALIGSGYFVLGWAGVVVNAFALSNVLLFVTKRNEKSWLSALKTALMLRRS